MDRNANGIDLIDIVAVNLYPFKETVAKPDVTLEDAIENIDIGGPSMVRSAAKNYKDVAVLTNPGQYGIGNQDVDTRFGIVCQMPDGRWVEKGTMYK